MKKMVQDVDQSIVLDSGVIDSPVLGKIPPTGLSGGVKTLILVKFEVEPFDIRILNTNEIVHTMEELVSIAGCKIILQD